MKKKIKLFIPPILFNLIRNIYKKVKKKLFNQLPEYSSKIELKHQALDQNFDDPWSSKNWTNHVKNSLLRSFTSPLNIHQKAVFNAINIVIFFTNYKKVNLIDLGGGNGVIVDPLLRSIESEDVEIEISIIDNKSIIKQGRDAFLDIKNIKFFDQNTFDFSIFMEGINLKKNAVILNLSSFIQYIPNYKKYLTELLHQTQPLFLCITRFPRCENAKNDAFAIQNITTPIGYCGSTYVNLFGRESLTDFMKTKGFSLLMEDFNNINDTDYFDHCDDEQYRNMTLVAYTFVKNKY